MSGVENSTPLVAVMLLGWIPAVLVVFGLMRSRRRAVIAAFLFAWLFLPIAEYEIKLFPEFNKTTATNIGVLCAVLLFDSERLFRFRPKWFDLPVVVLCFCPVISSLTNGLGAYNGFSDAFKEVVVWGVPYFVGRLYLDDVHAFRELAIAIFISGLVYVPLCLYEIRFSPQLHRVVYGYHQHDFAQVLRWGGYRPMVFLDHGLLVGMWMTAASICGFWLWLTKSLRQILGVPVGVLLAVLMGTTVLCKSTLAVLLLFVGVCALLIVRYFRRGWPITAIAAVSVAYVFLRALGLWQGSELVDAADRMFGGPRAQSLETRIENENLLAERARQQAVFGWSGWGRSRIKDERGRDISITDSLWIIKFGTNGLVGMTAFLAVLGLPVVLARRRVPPAFWLHPAAAPTLAVTTVLALWMVDLSLNAGIVPLFVAMAGGLVGIKQVVAAQPAPVTPARSSHPDLVSRRRDAVRGRTTQSDP